MADESTSIFVKIEDYKDVLDAVNLLKGKLNQAKELLEEIHHLKSEEDAELEQWSNNLAEVERKIEFVDQTLFEPEGM